MADGEKKRFENFAGSYPLHSPPRLFFHVRRRSGPSPDCHEKARFA